MAIFFIFLMKKKSIRFIINEVIFLIFTKVFPTYYMALYVLHNVVEKSRRKFTITYT